MLTSFTRRFAPLVLAAGTALAAPVAWAADAHEDISFELAVIGLVNQLRADDGLGPLGNDPRLHGSAIEHSIDMATTPCFQHDSCDGTDTFVRIHTFYPNSSLVGENIAAGQSTPAEVVDSWFNEAPDSNGQRLHRENILNPGFRGIGVGYYFQPGSPWTHYWTQDFGSLAAPVPEPDSGLLMLAGLGAVVVLVARRRPPV